MVGAAIVLFFIPKSVNVALADSYAFFERLGELLKTGSTGTNVCDLRMAIVT